VNIVGDVHGFSFFLPLSCGNWYNIVSCGVVRRLLIKESKLHVLLVCALKTIHM